MKFIIIFLLIFSTAQPYCQNQIPDLVIPIQITFQSGNNPVNMEIGLDSTATNCIDPQLGESQLPPIPPPGWEAVLLLPYPECQGSYGEPILTFKDFRFGEQPYTGSRTHRLGFLSQLGVTIHWSLPEGITGLLQEPFSGAPLYPMAGQDSFFVPTTLNELNMVINYTIEEPPVQVLSHITVTDGQTLFPRVLYFGLDSMATDSIDILLGESALPPFPPPGAFEARYILPENNFSGTLASYSDFRYANLPFTGQKEWRLAYQPGTGNTITIIWDFPPFITGSLKDIINGTLINIPISDSGSYTVENPSIFNQLRMIIEFNNVVPVELTSFSASVLQNEKAIQLNWSTATETNNSGFEILRFTQNDNEWNTIGFVPGFGTTLEPKSYSFVDENVTTGIYKYRLKQIDYDGSFTYSSEIEVEVDFTPEKFVLYENYPNPFNPSTTIKYEIPLRPPLLKGESEAGRFVTLKVYDILGNEVTTLVNEEKQPGVYEVEFSVGQDSSPDIASGIYFYQLSAGSFSNTKKMILLR